MIKIQNATECLASFLSGGRQDLLVWAGDPGLTMKQLLNATSRYCWDFISFKRYIFCAFSKGFQCMQCCTLIKIEILPKMTQWSDLVNHCSIEA